MIPNFINRLHIGHVQATSVLDIAPCGTFGNSIDIDERFKDLNLEFPNPWHLGTVAPHVELIQSELELLSFMFSFVVQLKPRLVVETGTNIGLMARALGAGCWTNGFGQVVTAETDEKLHEFAKNLCKGFPVDLRLCPALELPELKTADLVFIDSSYESRSLEHKLIKSGAVYVYHDSYAEPWVRPELDYELFKVHLDSPRGLSIVRKA